jgi:hypothetical protein
MKIVKIWAFSVLNIAENKMNISQQRAFFCLVEATVITAEKMEVNNEK